MAGKAERALVAGTDNVYDFKKYRALKTVEEHRDDIYARNTEGRLCLRGWYDGLDAPEFKPALTDYLGHHKRMVTATNKIKARRDFIDGNSTDN